MGKIKKFDFIAYAFAFLFFLKALILAFWITPLWDIPDESGHFAYAREIWRDKRIPLLGRSVIDVDILSHVYQSPAKKPVMNWIAQHPPVYHFLAGAVWKIGSLFTNNSEILFRLPRIVAAFSGAATLIVIYRILLLLGLDRFLSFCIMTWVSFIPMYSHMSSGVNHDTTVTFFAALAIYYWTAFILKKNIKSAYKSAFWLSVAATTKMTVLVFMVPMIGFLVLELDSPMKVRVRQILALLFIALFLPGLWMTRNYFVFKNPFATAAVITPPRLEKPLQESFLGYMRKQPVLEHFFIHFFGLFGWIGSGKGELTWFQIRGMALLFYKLSFFVFSFSTLIYLLKKVLEPSKLIALTKESSFIDKVNQLFLSRSFRNWIKGLFLLAGIAVIPSAYFSLWTPPHRNFSSLNLAIGFLAADLILSLIVFVQKIKQYDRVIFYSLIIVGFYSIILLWQIYKIYLWDGRVRATHGRYFYPLIPYLVMSLVLPFHEINRGKKWIFFLLSLLLGVAELSVFAKQVIPFYWRGF